MLTPGSRTNFIVTYGKLQSALAAAPTPRRSGMASFAVLPVTMKRRASSHQDVASDAVWDTSSFTMGLAVPPLSVATPAGPPNTGDKLRSSIACGGFVCFIPLFDGVVLLATVVRLARPEMNGSGTLARPAGTNNHTFNLPKSSNARLVV